MVFIVINLSSMMIESEASAVFQTDFRRIKKKAIMVSIDFETSFANKT